MNHELESITSLLLAPGKGILAADETVSTITTRFETLGIVSTEESRRAYREMLFTTPALEDFISGAILFDETIRQRSSAETPADRKHKGSGRGPDPAATHRRPTEQRPVPSI